MVMLGIANTRMKDFYDLWMLGGQFEFQGPILCDAIHATFDRRKTTLPIDPPLALTSEFAEDSGKQTQWQAFLRKGNLADGGILLTDVIDALAGFLMPPVESIVRGGTFDATWDPPGPWRD